MEGCTQFITLTVWHFFPHAFPLLRHRSSPWASECLLHCDVSTGCRGISALVLRAPPLLPSSLALVSAELFLKLFPHSQVPFYPFLNMFSQRCPSHAWGAQLCPVSPLEPALSDMGQPPKHLLSFKLIVSSDAFLPPFYNNFATEPY